ncbi:hypothetical protein Pelo_19603 [Pelomyxa schiedti]|nr:hypothetical protein Pelo_19603 [Pelomyxa schiedti]
MDYLVRDTRVVEFVCENGDLETAKWLVEKFRIPAWELHKAWTGACHSGNIQLFSWLYEVFCSLHDPFFDVHPAVAGLHAGKVDFFKWALENYPADVRGVAKDVYKELTPEVATVEFLEWLFNCKKFPLPKQDQVMDLVSLYCYSLETVKWFIDECVKLEICQWLSGY